jgi:hypothetical protein
VPIAAPPVPVPLFDEPDEQLLAPARNNMTVEQTAKGLVRTD